MTEPKCGTCRFWRRGLDYKPGLGDCRWRPPLVIANSDANECEFPWTDENEWCGEHQSRVVAACPKCGSRNVAAHRIVSDEDGDHIVCPKKNNTASEGPGGPQDFASNEG